MRDRIPPPPSPVPSPVLPPALPPAPSRRRVLRGTLALGATGATALAAAGCGSTVAQGFTGGAPEPDRLNFWNPFTGGDGERMLAMQDVFRTAHRSVDLRSATFLWGNPYYTKLTLATLGGRPPQVAVTHLSKVPTLVEAGLLSELHSADLARHGITPDRFDARPWQKSQVEGVLHAVPIDTHPFVLYFRTDIAEKAGLLDGQGRLADLDGPDAFIDAMRAAKEVTGAWGGSIASVKDASTQFRLFWSLYRQLGGGDLVADRGRRVVVDTAAAAEALAYMRRLTHEKVVPPAADGQGGAITLLNTGKAGLPDGRRLAGPRGEVREGEVRHAAAAPDLHGRPLRVRCGLARPGTAEGSFREGPAPRHVTGVHRFDAALQQPVGRGRPCAGLAADAAFAHLPGAGAAIALRRCRGRSCLRPGRVVRRRWQHPAAGGGGRGDLGVHRSHEPHGGRRTDPPRTA